MGIPEGVMDNDKSILEKITDTVKDIALTATNAANYALKADAPGLKADERAVAYMPLAADGLVSDPLMVPPVAMAPARKQNRAPSKRTAKTASKKTTKKDSKKICKEGGEEIRGEEVKEGEEDSEEGRQEDFKETAQ
jgi:hypothetical protein